MAPTPAEALALLLKGQLQEASTVGDGDGTTPATEYAPPAAVSKLARCIRSANVLENTSSWTDGEAQLRASLANKPIGRILFELSQENATGFLSVTTAQSLKAIALSAGQVTCIHSNLTGLSIAEVLAASGKVAPDACAKAQAYGQGKIGGVEVFLLHHQLIPPEDLAAVHGHVARRRLLQLFRWPAGEVSFYPDERAARLENVVNLPLLELLRAALWAGRETDVDKLKQLCAPILERPEELRLLVPLETLQIDLTQVEQTIVNAATNAPGAPSAKHLFELLAAQGDEKLIEGLKAAYLMIHIGVLGIGSGGRRAAKRTEANETSPEAPDAPTTAAQLEEYRQRRELDSEGRRLLNAGQYDEAAKKFDQLIEIGDRPIEALAHLSIAELMGGGKNREDVALASAKRALELDPDSALAHTAMCCALAAKKDEAGAENHEKMALALSHGNEALNAEVWGLLKTSRTVAKKKATPIRGKRIAVVSIILLLSGAAGYQTYSYLKPNTSVDNIAATPEISLWLLSGEVQGRGRGLPLFRGKIKPQWAKLSKAEKQPLAETIAYSLFERGLLDAEITCAGKVAIRIERAKVVLVK